MSKKAGEKQGPPIKSRFKKGQSGNPKGQPKGWKSLKVRIREILAVMPPPDKVLSDIKKSGLSKNPDAMDMLIIAQILKAWQGDTQAARFLCEYTDGRPAQPITADEPVLIKVEFETS